MVKVMDAPDAVAPLACKVCRKSADACHSASWVGLRRGLCRACYLREWRGTALPDGAACMICKERRRIVLRWTKLGSARIVTCQNCGFVADKARPRPRTVEELRERMLRERRQARERRRNYVVEPSDPAERRRALRRARRRARG
jgi:hypothetical protein